MNLVGKIFIVVIFVMSLVFMSFAISVYATHKNWRDVVMTSPEQTTSARPLGLQHQLGKLKETNTKLKDQLDKLKTDLASEKAAKRQALLKLEGENQVLAERFKAVETKYATLKKSEREAIAAMQATENTLTGMRGEIEKYRGSILEAEQDHRASLKKVGKLTDDLHQSVGELKRLRARQITLAADLAKAKDVLRHFGSSIDTQISATPPRVQGVVLAARSGDLIEISIGSDDGLAKGHTLEVYRQAGGVNTYLGRVEVMQTAPDKAVCKIIPEYRKGAIRRGDRVASKLG